MANLVQFYRGEKIEVNVSQSGEETMSNIEMLVYLDNLDITNPANASKIVRIPTPTPSDSVYTFVLSPSTTLNMKSGSYTIEFFYGNVTIDRKQRAFILVDSGYAIKVEGASPSQEQPISNEPSV